MKGSMKLIAMSLLLSMMVLFLYSRPTVASTPRTTRIVSQGNISYNGAIPLLRGWGGVRLFETNYATNIENGGARSTPESIVFPGEVASNAEMTMLYIKDKGYNTVRAYWEPPTSQQDEWWGYNDAWMQRFIDIAKTLDIWIIVDCHGYKDQYQYEDEWVAFWQDIISQFKDSYEKIVWQPQNEPVMSPLQGQAAVDELARVYQRWIDMCRGLGDTHWIVVSAVQFWSSLPMVDWYPVVTDPLDKVFYDWHYYYFYDDNPTGWTIAQAEANADYWFNVIKQVTIKYNRPYLCTEMGCEYTYSGTVEPPDVQYEGCAGYTNVTLAFIKRLVENFENDGTIGYILWSAGDWDKNWNEGWHYGGLYGGMDVWGHLLAYEAFWSS